MTGEGFVSNRLSAASVSAVLCGALAILIGAAVLIGWTIHIPLLVQGIGYLASVQRNTALCFVLSGLALLGLALHRSRITNVCAAIGVTISGLTLLEHVAHVNFGIDELLGRDYITTLAAPGRMAPGTTILFILLLA